MYDKKFYLCGKMSGMSPEESNEWKERFIGKMIDYGIYKIEFVNPYNYYNYENHMHKTEKEIMLWELRKVRECDLLVVNLDRINESVGGVFEIIEAHNNGIGVIGINENRYEVHPWIMEYVERVEDNFYDLCSYIAKYYM